MQYYKHYTTALTNKMFTFMFTFFGTIQSNFILLILHTDSLHLRLHIFGVPWSLAMQCNIQSNFIVLLSHTDALGLSLHIFEALQSLAMQYNKH